MCAALVQAQWEWTQCSRSTRGKKKTQTAKLRPQKHRPLNLLFLNLTGHLETKKYEDIPAVF